MDTEEKIAIMQAYINGEEIECKPQKSSEWTNMDDCVPSDPIWNWEGCDYRIKPVKPETLEERIREEYSGFDVVMLEERHLLGIEVHRPVDETIGSIEFMPHTTAQSMKGYYEYVYYVEYGDDLYTKRDATDSYDGNTIQPVGVLFTRGDK